MDDEVLSNMRGRCRAVDSTNDNEVVSGDRDDSQGFVSNTNLKWLDDWIVNCMFRWISSIFASNDGEHLGDAIHVGHRHHFVADLNLERNRQR